MYISKKSINKVRKKEKIEKKYKDVTFKRQFINAKKKIIWKFFSYNLKNWFYYVSCIVFSFFFSIYVWIAESFSFYSGNIFLMKLHN